MMTIARFKGRERKEEMTNYKNHTSTRRANAERRKYDVEPLTNGVEMCHRPWTRTWSFAWPAWRQSGKVTLETQQVCVKRQKQN